MHDHQAIAALMMGEIMRIIFILIAAFAGTAAIVWSVMDEANDRCAAIVEQQR